MDHRPLACTHSISQVFYLKTGPSVENGGPPVTLPSTTPFILCLMYFPFLLQSFRFADCGVVADRCSIFFEVEIPCMAVYNPPSTLPRPLRCVASHPAAAVAFNRLPQSRAEVPRGSWQGRCFSLLLGSVGWVVGSTVGVSAPPPQPFKERVSRLDCSVLQGYQFCNDFPDTVLPSKVLPSKVNVSIGDVSPPPFCR